MNNNGFSTCYTSEKVYFKTVAVTKTKFCNIVKCVDAV